VVVGEHSVQIGRGGGNAETFGPPGRLRLVAPHEREHLEPCRSQRGDVHASAEPGADDRGAGGHQ
jgi:hypothetical protein